MGIGNIHRIDKIVMPSAVTFSQLSNTRWSADVEEFVRYTAGHMHPQFTGMAGQKPAVGFTTSQLATLVNAIGVGGAALGSTDTYMKLATTTGSSLRANLSHKKITIAQSVAFWSTIRLPHRGIGSADVVIMSVSDGVNDPFVYAGSQALAGNLTVEAYFGAGKVSINGTEIDGIQDIEVASGVGLLQAGAGSDLWDTFVGIDRTATVVTIRTFEERNWSNLGLSGTILNGSTGLTFYARKYAADDGRVANATPEHIKFVGAYGMAVPDNSSGDDSSPISDTLRVVLRSNDDSTVPLTGTINSAIT